MATRIDVPKESRQEGAAQPEFWYRAATGVLHFNCKCGLDVPLGNHSANLMGHVAPEVDCESPDCEGPRLIALQDFQGGAI